jgi:hypothetical protein
VLKAFKEAIPDLEPSGTFSEVKDVGELSEKLLDALKWEYWVGLPNNWRDILHDKDHMGLICRKQLNHWRTIKLPDAVSQTYSFWEKKLSLNDKQLVHVDRGDLKIYELTDNKNELLRPASYAKRFEDRRSPWPTDLGWLMAVSDNLQVDNNQEMLVFVENTSRRRDDFRPRQIWLELADDQGRLVSGLRWGNTLGYPAPAWKVEVTKALESKSRLQAWVRDTVKPQRLYRRNQPLDRFDDRSVELEGARVVIESVRIETFPKIDELGKRLPRDQACLVVRLNYPKDQPVFLEPYLRINPDDPDPNGGLPDPATGGGYEHHFYTDAGANRGKYTGIFWFGNTTASDLNTRLERLHLYSINAFKEDKETTQKLVWELGLPVPGLRPRQSFLEYLGLREHSEH